MRDLHKSKYAQAIPGFNRIDDEIRLTSAEECVQHFGDGLAMPERLLADAANAHQRGRHVKTWFESMESVGEGGVREAFRRRDAKVGQWMTLLNAEVDSLAKEIEEVDKVEREAERKRGYLSEVGRASEMTEEFRRRIPDKHPNDIIDPLLKEEKGATRQADEVAQQCSKDMKDCHRKLEWARRGLMSEAEAKAFTLNISRRCQNSQPLLSFPYKPSDHPVNQIYHPNTEEDWELSLENKLREAAAARTESSACRLRTSSALKGALGTVADAWRDTSKGLQEEVQRDERTVHDIRKALEEIGKEVLWTKQRAASMLDDLRIQDRGKTRQLWRLQTLTYRPGPDHIRDGPARRCDEELLSAEKRVAFASSGVDRSRDLLGRLQDEKSRQTLLLDKVSKKLFIERENCLGLRRTVEQEGRGSGEYVTTL